MNLIGQCFNPHIRVNWSISSAHFIFYLEPIGNFWSKKFIFDKNNLTETILFVCVLECFLMFLNVSEQMTFLMISRVIFRG